MSRQESRGESFYPTKDQFACVRCKNKKFTSWNDFENHHAKHAVDFTFSKLPFVKLQQIKIPPLSSENLTLKHPDSAIQSSISIIDSNDTAAISTSGVVWSEVSAPCENKEPPASQVLEEEEMLTWPGSCESSSSLNSPISEIPVSASSETITSVNTVTGEPQGDSNILDPAFIEKLGEEINFLNQTSVESVPDTVASVPKEPLSEVQLPDENISGSSSASISISDFPVPSLIDISFPEPITPETPPTENAPTSVELDKPEDQLEKVVNEKEVSDNEENESISTPKKAELPKSKGKLRLVPYESLLSPSFLLANSEDDDESVSIQSPISPSKTSNKPQAMVAIPEQNLEDLNIPDHQSTANSVLVIALAEAVSTKVLQKSQPTPPPEITVQSVPPTAQTSSAPTQQQRMTQVYPFHGQGNRQPQVNQQLPTQQQPQQPQQHHQQSQPHLQQLLQQQQSQLQQHLQQQTPPIQLVQHQKQQQNLQQQTPQIQQHQQQMQQQQHQQQMQQQQQLQQHQPQQQQQQQQQQQTHIHQQQYPQQQQQHQNLSSMQYQQQQQAYQQIGQQQNAYAQTQAPQYIQRFSTPPRIQYPVQSYNASCRVVQPNQSTRATMNSTMTLSNSNGTIHVPPVSAYFQQITTNSVPAMVSSNPIQLQLVGQGSYNQAVVYTNNSFPHYSNRPQTSMAQQVQLQVATTRPPVATTQLRPQAITLPSQGIRVALSPALPNSVRLPPPTQQRQAFVTILPHPQSLNSVCIPTTSTTSATTSSTVRLLAPSHQGQTAANALNRPASQKRPLVVEGGILGAGQPAHKVARTEETTAASATNVSTAVSTAQQSGDCEVLIVQKKQTGLPVIQSVEGGGSSSTKSSVQALQTPSVASLLSNPNITITPAKNKENQTGSDSAASKSVNASTNSVLNVTRTSRPITVDLTTSTDSLPQQRNPLQCQVCNETFNSQSLLKNHLVLHLRKVHTTAARPTNITSVYKNQSSKQAAVNPPISRPSNLNGQTKEVTTPSTSGYVITQTSTTTKQATPAGIRPLDMGTGSVNANQQTKNGAASGQNRSTNEIIVVPPSTTSSTPSSCCKEPTAISMEKATSSDSEFYIPVVDLKRLDVITQLESMGINQFIPASNLTSCSSHNNFAIPIMSASALRKSGTTGFPSLCGVVNLGTPKPFSSSK